MKFLTIDYIKQHSRIDFDCEDGELELYGTAAEDTILELCRRTYENLIDVYGTVPPKLRQAALMLTDHFYTNRSVTSPNNLSVTLYGFDMMVKPFMCLSEGSPLENERDCLLDKIITIMQDFDFGYAEIENPTEELTQAYGQQREKMVKLYDRYGAYRPTQTICQALRQAVAKAKEDCDAIHKTE